jgi:hypothetical protein
MRFRSKHGDPIARAIGDLDRQIATLQREARELTNEPGRIGASPKSRVETITKFIKDMWRTPRRAPGSSQQTRQDLFEVGAEPLKELEAEPIAFAQRPEPDLFARALGTDNNNAFTGTAALEKAQVVPTKEKLAHYLGAGSIKSYKPLKRAQRQARNRFFMWLGLSFVALWIIWFVIR